MSYASISFPAASPSEAGSIPAAFGVSAWRFWVPFFGICLAIYSVEHSFVFSTIEYADGKEEQGLAELVAGSDVMRQASLLGLGLLGGALLLMPTRAPISINWWLLGLAAAFSMLMVSSALWAEQSALSLKRSVQPVLLMMAAAGVAKHWRPRDLCVFTVLFALGVVSLGIVASLACGSFLHGDAYRFGGTLHPNTQAVNCGALCLVSLALLCEKRPNGESGLNWRWLLPFVIGLGFLYLTRSRTTAAAVAIAVGAFFLMRSPRRRILAIAGVLILLTPAFVILLLDRESNASNAMFTAMQMGRDAESEDPGSLTGRIPIWGQVLDDIAKRPLLGYGCGSFWTAQRVWEYSFIRKGWQFNHAHNAYLETLLEIGAIGLLLGVLVICAAVCLALRNFSDTGDVGYRFIAAMLIMAMIHGMVDSGFVIIGFAPLLIFMCIFYLVLHHKPLLESA